jgi:hypothetical protein
MGRRKSKTFVNSTVVSYFLACAHIIDYVVHRTQKGYDRRWISKEGIEFRWGNIFGTN